MAQTSHFGLKLMVGLVHDVLHAAAHAAQNSETLSDGLQALLLVLDLLLELSLLVFFFLLYSYRSDGKCLLSVCGTIVSVGGQPAGQLNATHLNAFMSRLCS